jgi:hypothetical protein
MDEMRKRHEANKGLVPRATPAPRSDLNTIEIDAKKERKDDRKRFGCGQKGHLARACPKKEAKQDF